MYAMTDMKNEIIDNAVIDSAVSLRFESLPDGSCAVLGFADGACFGGSLVIPNTDPDGRAVTEIAASAFEGREIESVVIPASVRGIGKKAFAFCSELRAVSFEEGSELESIGNRAFCACDRLLEITLPETLKECGEKAFAYCSHLASIILPEGVEELTDGIFEGCRALNLVSVSDKTRRVGKSAFSACVSLGSVELPESVENVDDCAFIWCAALERVQVRNEYVKVSPYAYMEFAYHYATVSM